MRILLLNQVFFPDVAATAQHAHDLGRHLAAHGHEIVVIASRSIYGEKGATLPRREIVDGIHVHRVGFSLFGKAGLLARFIDFLLFYVTATWRALTIQRPDIVVCFTTPPFIGLVGWLLRIVRGSKYIYWAMDLYPDVLIAGGMIKERGFLARMLSRFNRFLLKRADRIVVLGRCMRARVQRQGIDPSRIACIGVWSDHEEVRPVQREDNWYRNEWSLKARFTVMYAGNFGLVHDVETMCAAAETLKEDERVAFAFVGGGKRKGEVESFVASHQLDARIAPYQPRDRLDALLSCADVHLVTLKPGFEGVVVPSKFYGIMAAGRPVIFIGPPTSEVALVIDENDCGYVIDPGDSEALVNAIRKLASNPAQSLQMGDNARRALREKYDRAHACHAWQRLIEEVGGMPDALAPQLDSNDVRP